MDEFYINAQIHQQDQKIKKLKILYFAIFYQIVFRTLKHLNYKNLIVNHYDYYFLDFRR
jgi:hypothetical protein